MARRLELSSFGYGCGEIVTFVSESKDALIALDDELLERAIAYHPDDAERWYLSAAACASGLEENRFTG